MRLGSDHWQNPELLLAILDEAERTGVYVMATPPAYRLATTNTTEAYQYLVGNITLVRDHPAMWGYYVSYRGA
jgi:hypothetical protein